MILSKDWFLSRFMFLLFYCRY